MKPSSFPVLNNRPIDQWKVTELREELKKRKLITKGLKEELVRRLDESLRDEIEAANQLEDENGSGDESQPKGDDESTPPDETTVAEETTPIANDVETTPIANDVETTPIANAETTPIAEALVGEALIVDSGTDIVAKDVDVHVDANNTEVGNADETAPIVNESVSEAPIVDEGVDIVVIGTEDQADGKNLETDNGPCLASDDDNGKFSDQNVEKQEWESTLASPVKHESAIDEKFSETSNAASEDMPSNAASEDMPSEAALPIHGSENEQNDNNNSGSRTQQVAEDIKPSDEEVSHIVSGLNNQVSEVSPSVGFPVKNDSVSNDSMTINEKNELKDNIIADDVKLEPDVKHEMVQPSPSPIVPDGGKSCTMDVEEPQSKVSVDETQITVNYEELSKKNASADLGSPEKLNLDRSSCDDSMEEDMLENKQVDSTCVSDEVGGRGEKNDLTMVKEATSVDIMGDDLSNAKKDFHDEPMVGIAALAEKRKLPDDQEAVVVNNEPAKRQRRWKTETVKVSESENPTPALSTTPRGTPQALGVKRTFSRSNSNADDDAPKERVVPPPLKPPTDSLRIDNFVRPFTLKAVQEFLGKTGTVTSFWMDHIKTHCYITYSSVEEATETRNAVYNVQWPPNGGRLLAAEFVDPQEVKAHLEGPPQPPTPVAPPAAAAPLQPSPRQQLGPKQKQMLQTNLPPPPPLTNPPPVRERLLPPPPPPPLEKVEPPVVTLDDLFRKTKSTPRIYYLPLSEEQVKEKLEAAQRRSSKQ